MKKEELSALIRQKASFLCVGLDTDPGLIPPFLAGESEDPVFEFNRQIIDATIDLAVAYKPNMAFYEQMGSKGWKSLERTMDYLREHPAGPVFTIADAKRADIGNTSQRYARAFFDQLGFDAITVNPYLGHDSVKPFLEHEDKWAIVLALTSNAGAMDFQILQPQLPLLLEKFGIKTCFRKKLFELVIEESQKWGSPENMMFVTGATHPEQLKNVRELAPDHFLLLPGIGAQGAKLSDIARVTLNKDAGIIVNSSRAIIYAGVGQDFQSKAREAAMALQREMAQLLGQ